MATILCPSDIMHMLLRRSGELQPTLRHHVRSCGEAGWILDCTDGVAACVRPRVRQRCTSHRTASGRQGDDAAAIFGRSTHDCECALNHYLNAPECCRATAAACDSDIVPNVACVSQGSQNGENFVCTTVAHHFAIIMRAQRDGSMYVALVPKLQLGTIACCHMFEVVTWDRR